MAAPAPAANLPVVTIPGNNVAGGKSTSTSRTVTDTVTGEHEHTIVGYSLVKGIGDGEPIASERFTVGGHEWVLLFYPDGKRSSSTENAMDVGDGGARPQAAGAPPGAGPQPRGLGAHPAAGPPPGGEPHRDQNPDQHPGARPGGDAHAQLPVMRPGMAPPVPLPPAVGAGAAAAHDGVRHRAPEGPPNVVQAPAVPAEGGAGEGVQQQRAQALNAQRQAAADQAIINANAVAHAAHVQAAAANHAAQHLAPGVQPARREATNDYAALFVALIGEGDNPQGVVNTSDGRVVRAFHRFTLVDQSVQGRDLTKGRRRDQGAVKISCARQDPNARNCHGYRKFVKRSVLENPANGYMVNDTIIIRYTIELVVSTGGALSRNGQLPSPKPPVISVPPSNMGRDMAALLESGVAADVTFKVEDEEMKVHRIILQARSPVFKALLDAPMREGKEGVVDIQDVRAPVFRTLLHFLYTDSLPEEFEGAQLEVALAQHLLVAADRFEMPRLRRICERRLCETVEVETVATTLALGEQNHAEELKRVCLEFVSRSLGAVMQTEGYQHMIRSCPQLQAELLHTIAVANSERHSRSRHPRHDPALEGVPAVVAAVGDEASRLAVRPREVDRARDADEMARRVRQRRE